MTVHRFLWLVVCGLGTAPGLAVSSTWPTASVVALFTVCAFLSATATVHYNLFRVDPAAPSPLRRVTTNVASHAVLGGVVMVALVGLSALIGAWVVPACVLVAGSSPAAVRLYRRTFDRVRTDSGQRRSPGDRSGTGHLPGAVEREVRELTETELCRVWRASFDALRAATSPTVHARIVAQRQAYLDELGRRNAGGLAAWLGSTGVPDDASPVLFSSTRQDETPIDWDALMFGHDDS